VPKPSMNSLYLQSLSASLFCQARPSIKSRIRRRQHQVTTDAVAQSLLSLAVANSSHQSRHQAQFCPVAAAAPEPEPCPAGVPPFRRRSLPSPATPTAIIKLTAVDPLLSSCSICHYHRPKLTRAQPLLSFAAICAASSLLRH
jgi:hypothetical protein